MTELQLVGKAAMRKKLASLSFSEKIKILEKLRDRGTAIVASGLRRQVQVDVSAKDSSRKEPPAND